MRLRELPVLDEFSALGFHERDVLFLYAASKVVSLSSLYMQLSFLSVGMPVHLDTVRAPN